MLIGGTFNILHICVKVNRKELFMRNDNKFCEYGKKIDKKLVDLEQTQEWLISKIKDDTGLFVDRSYMYKIRTGKLTTPKIIDSINKILEIT